MEKEIEIAKKIIIEEIKKYGLEVKKFFFLAVEQKEIILKIVIGTSMLLIKI